MKKDFDFDLFMETSAKTGLNAQELFVEAGKLLYREYTKYKKKPKKAGEQIVLDEGDTQEIKKKKCSFKEHFSLCPKIIYVLFSLSFGSISPK